MVTCLEKVHELGYVYNDLKPDNILIGNSSVLKDFEEGAELHSKKFESYQYYKIRLVDFGIVEKYLDEEGNHIEPGIPDYFRGSLNFASKYAFDFTRNTRRDDMISLAYNLVFMLDYTRLSFLSYFND